MTSRKITRSSRVVSGSDWVFVAVMLAAAVVLALWLWNGSTPGDTVVFRLHGHVVDERSLSEDADVTVTGDYTNIFRIQDGTVRVIQTNCPNHQCEHTGVISRTGQCIVCVPNEASATIEGKQQEVDALLG